MTETVTDFLKPTRTLPIFPLEGVILLPGGELPLNIFEERYIAMVKDAMASDRLIGMIQPCPCPHKMHEGARPYYQVGCFGRISYFEEISQGRFLINLTGISRFRILSHTLTEAGYRKALVDVSEFSHDLSDPAPLPECMTREALVKKIQEYMVREGLSIDWDLADHIPDHRFYTLLAMICPFSAAEKQALLEAGNFEERCKTMKCMMDIACAEESSGQQEHPC